MDDETDGTPGLPALRLSGFLPYRLSVLSNTISRAIADLYQREFGLSIWQWRVMAVLGEAPGLTAREVAERTAMDKVAVSRAVAGLEQSGHLARESDERDGRAARLSLSPSGAEIYRRIAPMALEEERKLLEPLDDAERAALARLMDKLARAASGGGALW